MPRRWIDRDVKFVKKKKNCKIDVEIISIAPETRFLLVKSAGWKEHREKNDVVSKSRAPAHSKYYAHFCKL